jgi:glycosyltransferase involved in cell wall biosynthesis
LQSHSNIHFHQPVSFEEAFKVMRESKILLNSSIKNKEGGHERIFMGLASGAAVVTHDCPFISENFTDGEDIIAYSPNKLEGLNDQLVTYLENDGQLKAISQSGRKAVLSHHTWDHRVDTIMEHLPGILDQMPSGS